LHVRAVLLGAHAEQAIALPCFKHLEQQRERRFDVD
jgi:hypothetical protein